MSGILRMVFIIVLTANLCGCSASDGNMHKKIHSKFYNMPSYSAKCRLTVDSNKTKNEYEFNCLYDSSMNRYRIDYPDSTVILTDTDARIIRHDSVINVPADSSHMLMFVNTFFQSYYESERADINTGALSGDYTMLETELVNPTKFGYSAKLWIDNKKVTPYNMKVFDREGKQTLSVLFEEFDILKSVQEEKFTN